MWEEDEYGEVVLGCFFEGVREVDDFVCGEGFEELVFVRFYYGDLNGGFVC